MSLARHACLKCSARDGGYKETGMRKKSPVKDTPCLYCGRLFTRKGVCEHERHSCPQNKNRRKRTFGKARCRVCGEYFHQNGLRSHMATQHPIEFAKDQATRKPTSRAAKRRELRAKQRDAHDTKRSATSRESARPRSNPPPKRAHQQHNDKVRKEHSTSKHAPTKTSWSDPRHPDTRNTRNTSRTRDATGGAWAEMRTAISRAAAAPGKLQEHPR